MATLFLKNPRLTILVIGLVCVAGLSSFAVLPRMEDPILTERVALCLTTLPGADAEQVESLVTEPIEDSLREIAEIKELRSTSRSSLSTLTIELRDDIYGDESPTVWSRIRDKISDAEAELPVGASKPRFEIFEVTAYTRLIALVWDPPDSSDAAEALEGDPRAQAVVRRQAEDLRELLLAVPGMKDVDIYGDPDEEIIVEVDPVRMAALNLTAGRISQIIESSDARVSAGLLRSSESDLLIEVAGELDSLQRIASIPLQSSSDDQFVTLADIADIRRTVKTPPAEMAIVDGCPAVVLACLIRPNQRIDLWHQDTLTITDQFAETLPKGIRLVDVFSQDGYVTDRLSGLLSNLLVGAGSVMLVILWLMGWRSAVIVSAALPLTAFMVLTGMRMMEIPVHQMSVTGLIIALGLLIDNAIVVVDEVSQKLNAGATRSQAVGQTVRHLAVPLFGSTFTTALAFAPIALMPGPAGEFVGAIAINVIVAIFCSLLLAMTVVPALTGFLSSVEIASTEQNSARSRWYQTGFHSDVLLRIYTRLLTAVTRRPVLGILLGVFFPVIGFVQARHLPEQFFPPADRNQVSVEVELPTDASIQNTALLTDRITRVLLEQEGVDAVSWWIGRSGPSFYYNQVANRRGQSQYAQALVNLDSIRQLRQRINSMQLCLDSEFPGSRILVRQLEQGPPFDAPIEVEIFGPDPQELHRLSNDVKRILASIPDVTHIRAPAAEPLPRLVVDVDEEEARTTGLNHQVVAQQLYTTLEGAVGGMVLEGTEELPVRVRVGGASRSNVDEIEALHLVGSSGGAARERFRAIPVTALGTVRLEPELSEITREDRRRLSAVQAYLRAGILPATVQAEFQARFEASDVVLPPGYSLQYGGESAQRDDAVGNLMASVGVLAVLMVAALVLSFSSFRLAALIGVVAALAVGLGLGALWVFGFPFGFMAIIGTMGLVGVAINDSIVVLAALREDEKARNGDTEAVRDVVIRATRHVVATSLTTMAGFLPLIISGGGFWPPMAVTIAGGVGGATILALIFVPACYLIVMKRSFQCDDNAETATPAHPAVA